MLTQIEWHPSKKQLRVFGVSGLLASGVLAVVLHLVWHAALGWSLVIVAAGAAVFLCSLISLRTTRVLYLGMTIPVLPIGFVVSLLLLAGFYFLVLTPVALVFRLIGRDPLCRSWRGRASRASCPRVAGETPSIQQEQGVPNAESRVGEPQDALATSYWVPHQPSAEAERYLHQF